MATSNINYAFCIRDNIIIGSETLDLDERTQNCTNIGDYILKSFTSNLDFVGQVDAETEEENTFQDMRESSVKCASWMQESGIQPNDVIMICTNNQLNAYIPFLAALYIGAVVSPLDHYIFEENISYFLEQARPAMIFIDEKFCMTVKYYTKQLKILKDINMPKYIILFSVKNKNTIIGDDIINLQEILDYCSNVGIEIFSCAKVINMKSTAIKLFTTGSSTASPVPVQIPHLAFMAPSDQHAPHMRKNDTAILFESLCFINGIFITIQAILLHVKVIRIKSHFESNLMCEMIQKYKVTWAFLETSMCHQLIKYNHFKKYYDLSSLKKVIFSGSADHSYKIHEDLQSLLPQADILQAYSLTKTGIIAYQRKPGKIRSSGYVSANVKLKIINIHPLNPQKLGPGEYGEICCISPYMMNNQDFLDEVLSFLGWLKTGDLGYYDQDGDIFVNKRINQVLKYQSEEEISSKKFEAVLYDHRAVLEASVIFIYDQDDNKYTIAFIRSIPRSEVTEEELKQHVIEKLGSNNQLQHVRFLLRLPRFTNGKINRKLLYNIARSDMFW